MTCESTDIVTWAPVLDELANIKRQKGEVDLQLEFMNKKYLQLKENNVNLQHNEVCSTVGRISCRSAAHESYCACRFGVTKHSTRETT